MKPRALLSLLILAAVFSNCFAVRNGILEVLPIFEDAENITSSSLNLNVWIMIDLISGLFRKNLICYFIKFFRAIKLVVIFNKVCISFFWCALINHAFVLILTFFVVLNLVKDNNWCDPDSCACYFKIDLQMGCICDAIKDNCNPGCNFCICTKSVPRQCQCRDLRDSCRTSIKQINWSSLCLNHLHWSFHIASGMCTVVDFQ